MKYVTIDDWHFKINDRKMKDFYASKMNKYDVRKGPKSLKEFSETLGFELGKPFEIYGKGSEAIFVIFGTANSATGYEIEFQDANNSLFAIIYPEDKCSFIDVEPSFLIGIVGYKLIL